MVTGKAEMPVARRCFVSFTGEGPPAFDFVFKDEGSSVVFLDATVSKINLKLDKQGSAARKELVRRTIGRFFGVDVDVDPEAVFLNEETGLISVAGVPGAVRFVVASTQHTTVDIRKSGNAWLWYANLDSLVASGWVPTSVRDDVARANSYAENDDE